MADEPRRGGVRRPRAIIRTHEDIIDYMFKNKDEFDILDAVSIHFMEIEFRKRLRLKRQEIGRDVTSAEIDSFVFNAYDTDLLDRYRGDAEEFVQEYSESSSFQNYIQPHLDHLLRPLIENQDSSRKSRGNLWLWSRQGIVGNAASLLCGALITLTVAAVQYYRTDNWANSFIAKAQACFQSAPPPGASPPNG